MHPHTSRGYRVIDHRFSVFNHWSLQSRVVFFEVAMTGLRVEIYQVGLVVQGPGFRVEGSAVRVEGLALSV